MVVYVLNCWGEPLMPCRPQKARKLLRAGKARVVRRTPFTIRLLFASGSAVQPVVAGMDTGSVKLGTTAVTNGRVVYCAEVQLRSDVSKKMKQRREYRRTRRGRKTRYRPSRYLNRASLRRDDRLAPSLRSKLESHFREKNFVDSILPISRWIVETAQFDIHRIINPDVHGVGYQQGPQAGFENAKAYVLHRDGYRCQRRAKGAVHHRKLHVHHVVYKSQGGTDEPGNLLTLCSSCHDALHAGQWDLPAKWRVNKTRHATHVGIVQARLKQSGWSFIETFGYLTKMKRRQLGLPKTHANDAVAVCCAGVDQIEAPASVLYKRHVAAGDYRQTRGKRSETKLPTGKLFGLRKFDLIETAAGTGFVKGKRASGYFELMHITGATVGRNVNVKKLTTRLKARTTTLVQLRRIK
ncbi:hypothetical protein LCGC14_0709510 [marine sediment metagenome]|uniref:HNH nuclease domain-containing protein n=1 Tax=marine sediment metagenome TaxID=412755 RepID=A0A0F9QK48_9ZZZZ